MGLISSTHLFTQTSLLAVKCILISRGYPQEFFLSAQTVACVAADLNPGINRNVLDSLSLSITSGSVELLLDANAAVTYSYPTHAAATGK